MTEEIKALIEISHFYGNNKEYILAGGGNTSYKNKDTIYVKASGTSLGNITKDGFAILDRHQLNKISEKQYAQDVDERERQVKTDLFRASLFPEKQLRPSVETSLHNLIDFSYVVHTHPTLVNSLMCSQKAKEITRELFGDAALFVEYTDPGYILFKKVEQELKNYRNKHQKEPKMIFLENHGVFVSADTTKEVKSIYSEIETKIKQKTGNEINIVEREIPDTVKDFFPAMRMMLSQDSIKTVRIRNNSLIEQFTQSQKAAEKINAPFTPDNIVYCKAHPLYLDKTDNTKELIKEFTQKLADYKKENKYPPKIILLKGYGLAGVEENSASVDIVLDTFEDMMKISRYAENFGGPKFLNQREIAFIDNWEVENYRRKISKQSTGNKLAHKIAIVTGGAQGFGGGIVEEFTKQGINVIIADINEEKGQEYAREMNQKALKNKVLFIKTNVADAQSVQNLMIQTIKTFGGLDVFISNAGVLRAGGLDEMQPDTFEFMTKVNYEGYFLCAKYASAVFKLQHEYKPDYFMDLIQINSKSGLKGSNKNFAYAGGKFGGVGLTQSFALELMPYKVKVNSICPGNFFDGPLWADPEKGLFVQYLNAGKVPGATTIEDVKKHYEAQVPAGRGCLVEDVMQAIYYVIEQKYETGQAIPVTGGQIMLS